MSDDTVYQPRWIAFCRDQHLPLDTRFHSVDFMAWINRKWREYGEHAGITEMERAEHGDRFTAWLEENT
jgi:hypothetical protein